MFNCQGSICALSNERPIIISLPSHFVNRFFKKISNFFDFFTTASSRCFFRANFVIIPQFNLLVNRFLKYFLSLNLDTPGDTIIMGTKGSLRIPSTDCWNGTFYSPMKIYHEVAGLQTVTDIPLIPVGKTMQDGLFYKKLRSFLDAVRDGKSAPVPSSEIIYNQAILDGIARSAELGREIAIEIPEI